jgi:hypothetical protein
VNAFSSDALEVARTVTNYFDSLQRAVRLTHDVSGSVLRSNSMPGFIKK